ncbi:MAG TPA: TPM domain-containing protein [Acidobacteriaceae bacterium]|nr:TPM domain-containing protein [Acidobacteriaceae bacterium]
MTIMCGRPFLIAFIFLVSSTFLRAERLQDLPAPSNYVNDFAGVLSPATRQSLDDLCAEVDRKAHAQIAVVTIKSLEGEPIENFATALEEKWKVGPKGSDRGLLVILATDDRKWRIEVGYGLEGILPDGKVGVIGRAMVPYLREGDYDQAVSLAVNQVAQTIAADAGVTLNAGPPRGPPQPQGRPLTGGQLLMLLGFFFVVIFLLSRLGGSGLLGFLIGMFFGGGWGGGGRRGGGGWGGDGGGGGFGGFGGGSSGGGGASGDW